MTSHSHPNHSTLLSIPLQVLVSRLYSEKLSSLFYILSCIKPLSRMEEINRYCPPLFSQPVCLSICLSISLLLPLRLSLSYLSLVSPYVFVCLSLCLSLTVLVYLCLSLSLSFSFFCNLLSLISTFCSGVVQSYAGAPSVPYVLSVS